VRGNRGARSAGVDGVKPRDILFGTETFLPFLRDDLKAGRFAPMPVRERMIPKAPGKLRRLGIPIARDRRVQASLKLVLEPIFEADFKPCSYGFRPRRRAHDAIAEIHTLAITSYETVLEGDITACFDSSRRTRGLGTVSPEAICFAPMITVLRLTTATQETRLTPPRPSIFAPAPTSTLFWRSSNSGRTVEKNSASCSSATSHHQRRHRASYSFVNSKVFVPGAGARLCLPPDRSGHTLFSRS
jgi:hypothetical protein